MTTRVKYFIQYRYDKWEDPDLWLPWGRASFTLDDALREEFNRCKADPDVSCRYRLVKRTTTEEETVVE